MKWHNYFLKIAEDIATRSKDKSTKVGAVIVDQDHRIVSTGYNGWISECNEDLMTQDRPMKYFLVVHAEMNALLFARRDLRGCKIYCTDAPCDTCLKHILQSGIREIRFTNFGPAARYSKEQVEAIHRLLIASSYGKSGVICVDSEGNDYMDLLNKMTPHYFNFFRRD